MGTGAETPPRVTEGAVAGALSGLPRTCRERVDAASISASPQAWLAAAPALGELRAAGVVVGEPPSLAEPAREAVRHELTMGRLLAAVSAVASGPPPVAYDMDADVALRALLAAVDAGRADLLRHLVERPDVMGLLNREHLQAVAARARSRPRSPRTSSLRAVLARALVHGPYVKLAREVVDDLGVERRALDELRLWLDLRAGRPPSAALPGGVGAAVSAALTWDSAGVRRALAPVAPEWLDVARLLETLADVVDDDLDGAERRLRDADSSSVLTDVARGIVLTARGDGAAVDVLVPTHARLLAGGDELLAALAAIFAMRALLMLGRLPEALSLAARPVAGRGIAGLTGMLRVNLARVHVSAGDVDAGRAAVQLVLDDATLPPAVRCAALRVQAYGSALAGDHATARHAIDEAFSLGGATEATRCEVELDAGEVTTLLGDHAAAITLLEHALAHYQRVGRPYFVARAASALAACHHARGEEAPAKAHLATASELAERHAYAPISMRTLILRGEMTSRPRDRFGDALRGAIGNTADLVVDRDRCILHAPRQRLSVPCNQRTAAILTVLAAAGAGGLSPESLHALVWGGRYLPTRHHTTVAVGVARVRARLARLFGEREVIELTSDGWRFTRDLVVRVERAQVE
ncbi:MAG: hypothetical protein JNL38_36100 [Myxococcales bacterium]|nr:hypothetical protein [Myxococcales bacterium]